MRTIINIVVTLAVMVGVWAECANLKVFAGEEWAKSPLNRDGINYKYCWGVGCGWNDGTWKLYNKIRSLGVDKKLGESIINECKRTALSPLKCVKTTVSIYGNESGFGKRCKNNSCWGVVSESFPSIKSAAKDFIKRYNKYWYRHNGGSFFYGGRGWLGKSEFCHDETSSGSKLGCPNGARTFNYFYNKL